MTILGLILSLVIIGLVVWLLVKYVPMVESIRSIVIIVAVLICLLIVLQAFGLLGAGVLTAPVPRVH